MKGTEGKEKAVKRIGTLGREKEKLLKKGGMKDKGKRDGKGEVGNKK